MSEKLREFCKNAEDSAVEDYRNDDVRYTYDECFLGDCEAAQYDRTLATRWLATCLGIPHYARDELHESSDAVTVYQRWLAEQDPDDLARACYSYDEYRVSPGAIEGYPCPAYEHVAELDPSRYRRVSQWINDNTDAHVDTNGSFAVPVGGQVEYIASERHKRTARLIFQLYS